MKREVICGIYSITSPTGRTYIGKSMDILKRWQEYYKLTNSIRQQTKIYNSLKKYSPSCHNFEILEKCDISEIDDREIYYIHKLNTVNDGLNCRVNGKNKQTSSMTRRKISNKKIGGKRPDLSIRNSLFPPCVGRTGEKHPLSKLVLNIENGVYYHSTVEAAESISMKPSTLRKKLIGVNKNTTCFIYV